MLEVEIEGNRVKARQKKGRLVKVKELDSLLLNETGICHLFLGNEREIEKHTCSCFFLVAQGSLPCYKAILNDYINSKKVYMDHS